ncbi:MAG: hypothetical protein Q8Q85_15835 [Gemmatimonadales bacterium]|nr:hypothetical protein [Gemmatimonadales bacterium]
MARVAAAPPPAPTSVAVLPFQNRSPDSTDAYLAEGMTEEVGNRLTQLGRLQVKARGLVEAQWRRTPDPFDAARRLNVAWFVHGSVRHAGSQLLVNVELVRTSTGEEIWASRFPRRDADVFAVQAEVAESVAVVVGGRLSPVERATLARRPTRSNEAYRLYLYGNSVFKRRTEQDATQALEAYSNAVRLDSGFAAAWARISLMHTARFSWGWYREIPADSVLSLAGAAARRALALDSLSADTWFAQGAWLVHLVDYAGARSSYERALRLDSLNAELYHWFGTMYGTSSLADPQAGEPLLRRALSLDPDLRNTWRHLGTLARSAGQLPEAEARLDTALALGPWAPAFESRAGVRFLRGNGVGALADLAQAEQAGGGPYEAARALYTIALGDSAPARALLERRRARPDTAPAALQWVARLSLGLGLRAEALEALERLPRGQRYLSTREFTGTVWGLLQDPIFGPLRPDPRFARLLEEVRPHPQ